MESSILTARQEKFLEIFSGDEYLGEKFCLSGGTALAGFYLHHRYSEDLDFFSETEFDVLEIQVFLKKVNKELGFQKIDYEKSYNRNLFFCHFPNEVLKIEFTFFPFQKIEKPQTMQSLQVESLMDLAVNKLFTIYQRSAARDYIDLYCICKERGLEIKDLISKARIKFESHIDPIQLGTQFIKAKDALDLPRMVKSMPEKEWRDFFVKEAEKLKDQVLD